MESHQSLFAGWTEADFDEHSTAGWERGEALTIEERLRPFAT